MKKLVAILLILCLCISLCACSSKNNTAEEMEVKSYLTNNYWYQYLGGNYDMESIYEFNTDGTYGSALLHSISFMDMYFEGTYEINTKDQTIVMHQDGGGEIVWTYSLYEHSMKVVDSSADEYIMVEK